MSRDSSANLDRSRAGGVTSRILIIVFVFVPLQALVIAFWRGPRSGIDSTIVSLYYDIVFYLLVLVGINAVLRRVRPSAAFTPAELLAFFSLMSVATCASGHDLMSPLMGTIQGVFRFASPENGWDRLFLDYVPRAMSVSNPDALENLWRGDSSFWYATNYRAWVGPLVRWWLFLSALWAAPVGLIVLFRRRWIEGEKMTFPVVQLPMEMVKPGLPAFRNAAFGVAFGIAVAVNAVNGLHALFPQVPEIPVKLNQNPELDLRRFFRGKPWDAVGSFYPCLYPFIIGLALLLPSELSLSLWFFFLFWKAEAIFCNWVGWLNITPEFPYFKEQSFGGYLAMIAFSVYAARGHFATAWRRIIGQAPPEVDRGEPLGYRAAFLLFALPALYCIAVGMSQRMAVWVSVAFFVQYYVMQMMVGRIRAEMGLPTHEIERLGPTVMHGNILGPRLLGKQNLTSLSLFFGFTRGLRNIPLPHQFEGLFFEHKVGLNGRKLLLWSIAALVFAQAWALLWPVVIGYRYGWGAEWSWWWPWQNGEAWNQLANWLARNEGLNVGRCVASVLGFLVYFGLMTVRTRFVWWPIHPAGFALSTTWFMMHMWFPMFIAWALKSLVVRYSHARGMRALSAAAYGLILGDITTGTLWVAYSLLTHTEVYRFWP
ncbi:MAG: hypothetical protein FJX75_10405 [Armatimonadetes bacterium]|nr:hypothetical protein [Armatimonadota bacterium]